MTNPIYLSITENAQGLISENCSTVKSMATGASHPMPMK